MNDTARSAATHAAWRGYAAALVLDLEVRGLAGQVLAHGAVQASNPAGEPDKDDPRGQLMSVGMRQEVLCRPHPEDGELWWWWAWSGPTRKSAPELEALCPAEETSRAAERIECVLRVPFAGGVER
ncbi:hypothetical protein ACGFNU_30225 [Spirillospora sp. NPDC048911]|uniref:hypothetical protein n=1 Tax=Spirillospora sp. NPDC048911 TaxID=3364527 RepID=UPI003721E870